MLCNLTFEVCSNSPKKVPMQGLDLIKTIESFLNQNFYIKAKFLKNLLRNAHFVTMYITEHFATSQNR